MKKKNLSKSRLKKNQRQLRAAKKSLDDAENRIRWVMGLVGEIEEEKESDT